MKNKSIITILSLCLGLSMATTSCDDMLTSDSNRHSYEVAGDTLYSYWGIVKSLQNIGERYVILGECRGDLIDGGEFSTDSVNAILSFGLNGDTENIKDGANRYLKVSDYYHVINSCKLFLMLQDVIEVCQFVFVIYSLLFSLESKSSAMHLAHKPGSSQINWDKANDINL